MSTDKKEPIKFEIDSTKGEMEIANDLKARFGENLTSLCDLLTEASYFGFQINFNVQQQKSGKYVLAGLHLIRIY